MIRKGDKSAFNMVYYHYVQILHNYCRKLTNDEIIVEECIQELFSDIWIKRKKINATENVKAYLLLSVKRRLLRKLNLEKKRYGITPYGEFNMELSVEDKIIAEFND
jgi:DNA-directed RNA polymerase specialized sigma24 family protein